MIFLCTEENMGQKCVYLGLQTDLLELTLLGMGRPFQPPLTKTINALNFAK